jgi:hypothetical protein
MNRHAKTSVIKGALNIAGSCIVVEHAIVGVLGMDEVDYDPLSASLPTSK